MSSAAALPEGRRSRRPAGRRHLEAREFERRHHQAGSEAIEPEAAGRLPDTGGNLDLRLFVVGDVGAEAPIAGSFAIVRETQLESGTGLEHPDLHRVSDPMPMGDFACLKQIVDQGRMTTPPVRGAMAIGLPVVTAFGMRFEAEFDDEGGGGVRNRPAHWAGGAVLCMEGSLAKPSYHLARTGWALRHSSAAWRRSA